MRRIFISLLVLLFICAPLVAEEELDIDALFEEPAPADEGDEADAPTDAEIDLLTELVQSERLSIRGDFTFYGGYSPGFEELPNEDSGSFADTALMEMQSALSLDFQISPQMRVYQKYSMSFPDLEPEVSEFFADYTVADRYRFRLGRHNVTWGISRNFPFINLPARIPDYISGDDADSYALKATLPVGIGGVELLAYTRNGYFDDPDAPAVDEIGYGGRLDLAFPGLDIDLMSFYHRELRFRNALSLSTTLAERYELYTEGLVSLDDQTPYYSWNVGALIPLLNDRLELNAEYFHNGEEGEQELKGAQYPLFPGENLALNLSFTPATPAHTRFLLKGLYNADEQAGVVIPGIQYDGLPHLQLNLLMPCVLGNETDGYRTENPDTLDRPFSLVLMARLKGSLQKDIP